MGLLDEYFVQYFNILYAVFIIIMILSVIFGILLAMNGRKYYDTFNFCFGAIIGATFWFIPTLLISILLDGLVIGTLVHASHPSGSEAFTWGGILSLIFILIVKFYILNPNG